MSSSLMWWPASPVPEESFDTSVKFVLRKRYGDFLDTTLTANDLPYLEGLRDGGVPKVQEVIDAINKHGAIRVKEEF